MISLAFMLPATLVIQRNNPKWHYCRTKSVKARSTPVTALNDELLIIEISVDPEAQGTPWAGFLAEEQEDTPRSSLESPRVHSSQPSLKYLVIKKDNGRSN